MWGNILKDIFLIDGQRHFLRLFISDIKLFALLENCYTNIFTKDTGDRSYKYLKWKLFCSRKSLSSLRMEIKSIQFDLILNILCCFLYKELET